MARNRPGSAKNAIRQQEAAFRRGAPGAKQFIGGTAEQSRAAKQAERHKVERMAEIDQAGHVAEEVGTPVSAIVAELVQDSLKLAWTVARAPFRIAQALVRPPRTA
jgi:hypothetical protein